MRHRADQRELHAGEALLHQPVCVDDAEGVLSGIEARYLRQERPFGQFTRVIGLPALVDADKVEATYEFGVLRLTLPKSEAAKPRKITVKGGE